VLVSVPFIDLDAMRRELGPELDAAATRVLDSGRYLLGPELDRFETDFARHVGAGGAVGVGSGLNALTLALRALDIGPGDDVIVPSNTYIATWLAVSAVGATPVPVEPDPLTHTIDAPAVEAALTVRTAAVLAVHLYGLPADVEALDALGARHGLAVVYDAAQAHGATVGGRPVGSFGTLSAWSFYPTKNLGAFGDGGAVTSDDASLLARVRRLANYGSAAKNVHVERGVNSRLDEVQAAWLSVKLTRLEQWNRRRAAVAAAYREGLVDADVILPVEPDQRRSCWHLFVVRHENREGLQAALRVAGVASMVHYPTPPHRQPAYASRYRVQLPVADLLAAQVCSLPMGPHLSTEQVDIVIQAVRGGIG
jgi:dTDP-4-amino-4,6-dideoxygalactose transaminase